MNRNEEEKNLWVLVKACSGKSMVIEKKAYLWQNKIYKKITKKW